MMNERILKLFTKACYHGDYEPENVPNAVVEKFAQLIVQECFDVVVNDGRFHDAKGIIRAGKGVAMEHFGVEE
jgi:hypothetical protein